MKRLGVYLLLWLMGAGLCAQPRVDSLYRQAFGQLTTMLNCPERPDFERAVFLVENAYFGDSLDPQGFDEVVQVYADVAKAWLANNHLSGYHGADSTVFALNGAVFHVMTDTTFLAPGLPLTLPFLYDTADYFAVHDWRKMLVTKLLLSHSGNCHSLPYLYKMICQKIGGQAWLALAPNHMYLKQHSAQIGWYNTELTSAAFPSDAWIMASGYVSADAVRSGIYMDTLSAQQELALCLVDLAQGYQAKAKPVDDAFVLQCCDAALMSYPACTAALLVKAETLGHGLELDAEVNDPALERTLTTLVQLGYREIPFEVYLQWMRELNEHRETYLTPLVTHTAAP